MAGTCATCTAPLASRDRSCPQCGAAVVPTRTGQAPAGRRVLVDAADATPAGHPTRTAAPAPTRPLRRASPEPRRPRRAEAGGLTASGTVTGAVVTTEIVAVGRPQRARALVAACLLVAAVLALLLGGGAHRGPGLGLLLPTAAAAAGLVAVPFLIARDRARTAAIRFTLTPVSGEVVACELRGTPTAPPPRPGELVEVFGRGRSPVRVTEIVRGEERLRGRPPTAFLVARHAPTAALALSAVCVVLSGALVLTA